MNKKTVISLLNLFAMPVLMILLGLVLIFNPDAASALVGKVLGWGLVIWGAITLLGERKSGKFAAVVAIIAGIYLLKHPLVLAKWLGRILGVILLVSSVDDVLDNLKLRQGKDLLCPSMLLATVSTLGGIILILLPMTTSRLLFMICGIVVLCIGAAELLNRLKDKKRLNRGEKPEIIDADE